MCCMFVYVVILTLFHVCVREKRAGVMKKCFCGVSEMLRRCMMSKILVTSPFSLCNEA